MMSADESAVVWLSVKVALAGTLGSLPFAVVVAFALARGRFWGRSLLNAAVHLPLVLPPVVTGYVLLRVFGRQGAVGARLEDTLGIVFTFRWTGAALAAAVMGFPLMVRAIRLSMNGNSTSAKLRDLLTPHVATDGNGVSVRISYICEQARCEAVLGDAWRIVPSEEAIAALRQALDAENVLTMYD